MVEEVVGHLLQQRVGVEIEADLRTVPPGIREPAHAPRYPYSRVALAPVRGAIAAGLRFAPYGAAMGFPSEFWWGTGASSTQAEGAAPASDWYALERARARAADRNRERLRHPLRRGLRAVRGVRAAQPPPVDRVGTHRARRGPARRSRDRALPRGADGRARRRRQPVGVPAPLHAARLVHRDRRRRLRRRAGAVVLLAPPRRVLRGDVRRPRVRVEADQRTGRVLVDLPHRRTLARGARLGQGLRHARRRCCSRSATRGARLRGSGQPVATIHNLSPVFRVGETVQTTNDRPTLSTRSSGTSGCAPIATACSSSRDACRARCPDLREACDLVGFSYYSAIGIDNEGRQTPYPANARVGSMGYAPWSEGLGIVLHRLHDDLPGRPLLICEHGVGTDDDEFRCDVLRESLGHRLRRDRRRRRRARLLPLDRRRQLRVGPRLRRAVRRVHARPRTPRQRRAPPRLRHALANRGFGDNRRQPRS